VRHVKTEIDFAGFGGQGILLMGKIAAQAAVEAGLETTYLPTYGPEMRGGTANSVVIIADVPIASPMVSAIDVLVAMNQPSLDKFGPAVRDGGMIIFDSTLATPPGDANGRVTLSGVPFTRIAGELGNVRVCNMAALGRFVRETKLVSLDAVTRQMKMITAGRPELAALNEKALAAGYGA